MLNQDQFCQFMKDQVEEINRFKWIESEKVRRDLGEEAVIIWITKFAIQFRKEWFTLHDIE